MGKYRKAVQLVKNSKKIASQKQLTAKKVGINNLHKNKAAKSVVDNTGALEDVASSIPNKLQMQAVTGTSNKDRKKRNPKFDSKKAGDDKFEEIQQSDERTLVAGSSFQAEENEVDDLDTRKMVITQNRKKKKSGGFQSMGLSYNIYKAIQRKGYQCPTPIQRKTIPLLMDGKDVVAMARTGSGKTAAFLIPMFEKLHNHSTQGARALILSPTRELATQTLQFTKELGKFTDLKFTLVLGGDSMENQFAMMHDNPDIIIASPGRFLHILVEMGTKKLDCIEYVVFDEADRLFEMGFAEQLQEIIKRLPESRQTLLFSATLPKVLVDFAKAGLNDPSLVRLDVDSKLSDQLQTSFFLARQDDKLALLLHILQSVVKEGQQTVVFVATKHHVEYVRELLTIAGISCSYIYSSLDQAARKINVGKFQKKKTSVLVVTDVAARGIDIPMLDNVVNYDFPAKPKLFIHRVGRVARAGRSGHAYSLLTSDEIAYVIDLHLFLSRPLKVSSEGTKLEEDGCLGSVPQVCIDEESEYIRGAEAATHDLESQHQVMLNSIKQYLKSRPAASQESVKRAKSMDLTKISCHPLFAAQNDSSEAERLKLLNNLRSFKPTLTVFESKHTKSAQDGEAVMKTKRSYHSGVIERNAQRKHEAELRQDVSTPRITPISTASPSSATFDVTVQERGFRDDNYIEPRAADFHGEQGLNIKSFERDANHASVDFIGDETSQINKQNALKKWDRKRKKFVSTDGGNSAKKMKTESGNYIPASYKSNIYGDWIKKNKFHERSRGHDPDGDDDENVSKRPTNFRGKNRSQKFTTGRKDKRELKSKEQMVSSRVRGGMSRGGSRGKSRGGGMSRGGGTRGKSSGRGRGRGRGKGGH